MISLRKLTILVVICVTFFGTPVYAFELLFEEQGKAYYKTDDGKTIERKIQQNTTSPTFLYRTPDNQVMYFRAPNGKILEARRVGAAAGLPSVPEYDWRNGCSPTSTGMMMGYYDLSGYGGLFYQKLIPRGPAEMSTFVSSSQRANKSISSSQHISDYYTGYGNSADDPCDGDLTTCHGGGNSLADFMGTSQDMNWLFPACNATLGSAPVNTDGGTMFWNFTDGSALFAAAIGGSGSCYYETSGMYGIGEYVQYRGYNYSSLYNQKVDAAVDSGGFTYANFKNEIDNGRPVLIHVIGHTMLGYGYSDPDTIYLRDTWSSGLHTMTWGGLYSGMLHNSVTCFSPSGGSATPDDIVANVAPALLMLLSQ